MKQSLYGFGDKLFGTKIDIDELQKALSVMEKQQFPFACSRAINQTLKFCETLIKSQMGTIFERPTPFTLKSLYIRRATYKPLDLYGEIGFRYYASKGTPASRYLYQFVYGGERKHKASETLLARRGLIPNGSFLIMAGAAKKNEYGNISNGLYNRMLSAAGAMRDVGHVSNSKSKAKRNAFFIGTPKGGNRSFGIYSRSKSGLKPLWFISSKANYKPRFPIAHIIDKQVSLNFPGIFENTMKQAIATAKIK